MLWDGRKPMYSTQPRTQGTPHRLFYVINIICPLLIVIKFWRSDRNKPMLSAVIYMLNRLQYMCIDIVAMYNFFLPFTTLSYQGLTYYSFSFDLHIHLILLAIWRRISFT